MLSRREFLHRSTETVAAGVVFLLVPIACGSSGDSGVATSTGTTLPNCDGIGATSSVTVGHSHTVCIPQADLASPPSTGQSYATSVVAGHQHAVMLTQAQLTTLAAAQTVDVTTSIEQSHTHNYRLIRQTQVEPTPTPTVSNPPVTGY